jgi:NAD(P)-dependent dehydrogenase (short-subunit alcohol dehydrogenase family)
VRRTGKILSDLGIEILVGWLIWWHEPDCLADRKTSLEKWMMPSMNLTDSVALVTGANRGLGARLVAELLRAGAAKVYATSRADVAGANDDPRVRPLILDVTDPASVAAAAASASDVSVLVNNAGALAFGSALDGDLEGFERDLHTNYLGTLRVTRAFAPALARNAPAAVVNILTLIALAPMGSMAGYSASKAAAHSITQALRAELRPRGITVLGAYPGGIDTDMLAGVEAQKAPPQLVASRIVSALVAGEEVVFPDDASAAASMVYLADPLKLEQMLTG